MPGHGLMWCDGHVVGSLGRCARVLCPKNCGHRTIGVDDAGRLVVLIVDGLVRWCMSGGAAGGDSHGRVHVVGNVPACVPGGGNAELADLQIGVDAAGWHVVLIKQLVQCARVVRASAANTALATGGASLAQQLGHGDALQTATWGKGSQCTCDVKHVETVFDWAVEGHGGINVMVQEQRAELVAAVHKAACESAATRLTCARGMRP